MKKILILIAAIILILTACGKKQQANKNIETIQKEQGIPVRVMEIITSTFKQDLSYNATLSGIMETTAKAMLSEVVTAINAKVGDRVSKDQVIVTYPANSPAAQYTQAQSAYLNASATYQRMQRLFEQGAISKQDLDNMETGYKVAKANFEASGKMISIASPIDGVITAMHINPSEMTYPGQDLFTVSQTHRIKALLWVPESEISMIRRGSPASIKNNEQVIAGTVTQIALALDQNNKAFRVECEFNNPISVLKPGTTAPVSISIRNIANAIVIPRHYITGENGNAFVWIMENDKALRREITLGETNQIEYQVLSGIEPGDKLIIHGINLLTEDVLVRVID
ncbi:MAG: efflux RND transporter periplasmic adaptor subunit [Candidatus Cloacimonetes bacterium]|nr:efflux RND transporter periplasmic adaptor subunit [Candidatus Cloacimonadota bacterium]